MWQGRAFFDAAVATCQRLGRRGLLLSRRREHIPPDLPPVEPADLPPVEPLALPPVETIDAPLVESIAMPSVLTRPVVTREAGLS